MKKLIILLALAVVLIGCDKEEQWEKKSKNLDGTWMRVEYEGEPLSTDEKSVMSFNGTTRAFSYSHKEESIWKRYLTKYEPEERDRIDIEIFNLEIEAKIHSYSDEKIEYSILHTNGAIVPDMYGINVAVKVTDKYQKALLGTWENMGDGNNKTDLFRVEYLNNNRYNYYIYNEETLKWETPNQPISKYELYGSLFITSFELETGEKFCEMWEIESIKEDIMTCVNKQGGKTTVWKLKRIK